MLNMRNIPHIQLLRALAALSVTMCHFDSVANMLTGHANDRQTLYCLASGVDLFFVISGFIMVYSQEALFAVHKGPLVFLVKRLAKIVPLYWLTTVMAVFLMDLPVTWHKCVESFLFIPYWGQPGAIFPLHGVGWSLNFEMFFYMLFAVALCWPRRIAVPSLCAVLGCIVFLGHQLTPKAAPLIFWSDPIILEFAFGMIIALLHIQRIRLAGIVRWLLIAVALLAIWLSSPHMPPSGYRAVTWGIPAAMIVVSVVLTGQMASTGRIIWLMRPIGDASYSIYLIHPLMGAAVFRLWPLGLNHYPVLPVLTVAMIATIAISVASFQFFEKKTTRAIQQLCNVSLPRGEISQEVSALTG